MSKEQQLKDLKLDLAEHLISYAEALPLSEFRLADPDYCIYVTMYKGKDIIFAVSNRNPMCLIPHIIYNGITIRREYGDDHGNYGDLDKSLAGRLGTLLFRLGKIAEAENESAIDKEIMAIKKILE